MNLLESRDLHYLHGGHTPRAVHGVSKTFDGYYALQFMQGTVSFRVADQREKVLRGCWMWFTYPGPHFRYRPMPGEVWHHRHVAFSGTLAEKWLKEGLIPQDPHPCPDSEISYFSDAIDSVLHWFEVPGNLGRRRAINLMENLIIDLALLRNQKLTGVGSRSLGEIVTEQLERRSYAVIKTSSLAKFVGLAESTFRRKFQRETGVPINRYLIERRLQKARHLLAESKLSIQEIADRTGFSDVYYFHRMFSRFFQITPKRFRQKTRG